MILAKSPDMFFDFLPKKFQNFSQIYTRKQDFLKKIPIFVSKKETLNANNWALNRTNGSSKQTKN